MDVPVTESSVRALVTQMVKDYSRTTVVKEYAGGARALLTTDRIEREEREDEDIEEEADDE